MELPATAALDFPTVLALAGYVAQSLAPATEQSSPGALGAAVSLSAVWSEGSGKTGRRFHVCAVPRCFATRALHTARTSCARPSTEILAHCCAEPGEAVTQVVGVSCTYPGPAATGGLSGFWGAAVAAIDLPAVIPFDRWAIEQHYSPDVAGG